MLVSAIVSTYLTSRTWIEIKSNSPDTEETNVFEVQLPRWRNRVHIYEDPEKKGYIFTLRLDRLGFVKNCKRRLGYDYKVLHVKGDKPCEI